MEFLVEVEMPENRRSNWRSRQRLREDPWCLRRPLPLRIAAIPAPVLVGVPGGGGEAAVEVRVVQEEGEEAAAVKARGKPPREKKGAEKSTVEGEARTTRSRSIVGKRAARSKRSLRLAEVASALPRPFPRVGDVSAEDGSGRRRESLSSK